ncbi:microfibrillar-associated protein 1 [Neocloeon triangulifer]|uniref:microfibrillar-associated protein 1 n=1 Tax=Neocloeon triangulifer TaxID=2078957 RepID=UPI00286F7C13|nr:microfibrillar-associated protein 1 [Neocloeon triangulifer]
MSEKNNPALGGIQSTAGAIPVRNKKGEITMQKVKVHRYISGKRPDYAPDTSSEEESDREDFIQSQKTKRFKEEETEKMSIDVVQDRRLERLRRKEMEKSEEEEDDEDDIAARRQRRRAVVEPEILEGSSSEDEKERSHSMGKVMIPGDVMESDDDDEVTEEDLERRRALIRQKLLQQRRTQEEEVDVLMEDDEIKREEETSDDTSEYEEYTDSEEEDLGPRLKPVFVRKRERLTVAEKEKLAEKERLAEIEAKRAADERKRQSIKMVEEEIRKEAAKKKPTGGTEGAKIDDVCTDDENDELEYEAWKIRELKRIKRDKEEKEQLEKERMEIERLRNMTEEQRRQELRNRPKVITNKAAKGKYKFLQKYYHRGAFYLDEDDEVYKRDFSGATLEDHFDKSVLPKVMQVKNFGRSGRTKYTHLVDQDTTAFDSPWSQETTSKVGTLKSTASTSSSRN